MKLSKLLCSLTDYKVIGDVDIEIDGINIDSNSVTDRSLFICLKGRDFDGHNYIRQVEMYGAVAVLTEKKLSTNLVQVIVKDTRKVMNIIAKEYYNNPDKKLKLIGVCGTNGKTTTAHIIKTIFDTAKIPCGVIGTLGTFYNDKYIEPSLTTPDPLVLHKIFSDMVEDGIKVVVMEVSAHSVALDKLNGLSFEVAIETNFTQDHLDFFIDMETYKQAKLKFFNEIESKYTVVNSDDSLGIEILRSKKGVLSYGIDNPADVFAVKMTKKKNGSNFVINLFDCLYEIDLNLIGKFNVYNALASASATALMGVSLNDVKKGLESVKTVSGRLEKIYDKDFSIFIDYAHTPDGLLKSITALKDSNFNRIILVFGCGGNRDNSKRKIMGQIAGKYSDFSVITSDNPRYEEPMEIISEIESGMLEESKNYVLVQDRAEGIRYAINMVKSGDVILVAGKGSEQYQEILGTKHVYNDKDTIMEILG